MGSKTLHVAKCSCYLLLLLLLLLLDLVAVVKKTCNYFITIFFFTFRNLMADIVRCCRCCCCYVCIVIVVVVVAVLVAAVAVVSFYKQSTKRAAIFTNCPTEKLTMPLHSVPIRVEINLGL